MERRASPPVMEVEGPRPAGRARRPSLHRRIGRPGAP